MFKLNYPKFWQDKKSFASNLLVPFSFIYILASKIRNFFTPTKHLPIPVICIGNVTIGGTGKTQMALYLARYLTKNNIKICIASKGYGRKTNDTRLVDPTTDTVNTVGDEAFMLAKYFPVIVYKKITALTSIINQQKFEIVIFDDGMQNPAFHKDLTILMIDGLRGFGNKRIIPAGPLRETVPNALAKSDIAIIIGKDKYNIESSLKIPLLDFSRNFIYEDEENKALTKLNIIEAESKILKGDQINHNQKFSNKVSINQIAVRRSLLNGQIIALSNLDHRANYFAFAGIGNPDKFFLTLSTLGLNIIEMLPFPDHYNYSEEVIEKIYLHAKNKSCILITTEKDWVKLPKKFQNIIKFLEVTLDLDKPNNLYKLINEKILCKIKISN